MIQRTNASRRTIQTTSTAVERTELAVNIGGSGLTQQITGIYKAPPANPYTTPCSEMRCQTCVAKLDRSSAPVHMNKPTTIMVLVHCGYRWVNNTKPTPSIYWIANVTLPIALMEASEAVLKGGWDRYHS